MATATIVKTSPTQWFGDRGLCQNCGLVAHEAAGTVVHTGTERAECAAPILAGLTTSYADSDRGPSLTVTAADGLTYDEGRAAGAVTVAHTGWSVSHHTSATVFAGAELRVFRCADEPNEYGGTGVIYYHETLNGLRFADTEASSRAAYEAGVLGFHFYHEAQAEVTA